VAGGSAQLVTQLLKLLWLSQSEVYELRASARLFSTRLRTPLLLRIGILVLGAILSPPLASPGVAAGVVFAVALTGEWLGRWLFFVSVVPKNAAASFIRGSAA
jgi:hypothetical protein